MTLRILLIDDDQLLGQLIRTLVSSRGGELIQVMNGKRGIEIAKDSQFDHILVDLMLPQVDGLNVIRQLNQFNNWTPKPKLTAISSRKSTEQQLECAAAGASQFLEKPVKPQALFHCLGL
jgi:CheY-like chemotaxis protein